MAKYSIAQAVAAEGVGLLAIRVFSISSGFLIVAILTRGLGPDGYGTYAFVQSFSAVLSLAMHWGIYTFLTREVAASIARSDLERAQAMEAFSRAVVFASIPVVALIFIVCCAALSMLGMFDLPRTIVASIILLAAINACQQRGIAILSGRSRQVGAQIPEGFARPALFITTLLALASIWREDPVTALYFYVFAAATAFAVTSWLTIRTRPSRVPDVVFSVSYREWLGQLPPFALIGMIGIAMANADVLLLFNLLPRSDLGQYKLAAVIASIPANLHSIVISMLMPRAAAAWARGDKAELTSLAHKASRTSFAFAAFYAAALVLVGQSLITYAFGPAYDQAYRLSCLLIVPGLCTTFVGSAFTLLNMCGEAQLNSAIALVGLFCSLISMWAFGTLWGADGAAVATIITALALNVAAWAAVKRRIGIRCDALG
ncbi:oligosaccharide flippase family protein [Novosphingobium sp. MW5]|nr:oligosaccharide flippase family protein [Novosphingobium sp. MW5]